MLKKKVYDGFIKVYQETDDNGKIWESIKLQGGVIGVIFNPYNQIAMVKQYRVPRGEYTLEFPAGNIDKKNLTPREIMIEELEEECQMDREYIHLDDNEMKFISLPAIINADMTLFTGTYKHPSGKYDNVKIENDDVEEMIWVDIDELVDKVTNGEIIMDSTSLTSLFMIHSIRG